MGFPRFRVVRFHKHYYTFINTYDCSTDGLGEDIKEEIPTDEAGYKQWLAVQRKFAEEWEAVYKEFLSIKPGNRIIEGVPIFMREDCPSLLAPLNYTWIEWIYIDRDTFTVNNGAHFKLEMIPHIDWINSLAHGGLGDKISLPDAVPTDAVTNLVIEPNFQSSELLKTPSDPTISNVSHSIRCRKC